MHHFIFTFYIFFYKLLIKAAYVGTQAFADAQQVQYKEQVDKDPQGRRQEQRTQDNKQGNQCLHGGI